MAENKVEIIISAKNAATGAIEGVRNALKGYESTLASLNGAAQRTGASLRNMIAGIAGTGLFAKAISEGYRFNTTIEDTKTGFATLLYSMNTFKDATGRALAGQDAFQAALAGSEEIQNRLRIAGLSTAATYEQLTKAFSQAYVPAVKAGFDDKQVVKFTTAVTQAATAMRVPLDMLGEEVRSILSGSMTPRTTILQPLLEQAGLTNEKIRSLVASGKLYESVMKALEGASMGASTAAGNFSVRLSNLHDAISQALGRGLDTGFQKTKILIQEITDSIVTLDEKTGEIKWNEDFISAIQKADGLVFSLVDGVKDLSKAIAGFAKEHPVITELAGKFTLIAVGAGLAITALRGLGGMFVWLRAVSAANLVFLSGILGGIPAALSAITVEAAIAGGALSKIGLAAGAVGAYLAGWQIGKLVGEFTLAGKSINEYVQIGYAKLGNFFAYIRYFFASIATISSAVWTGFKASVTLIFYEVMALLARIPGLGSLLGLFGNMEEKASAARVAFAKSNEDRQKAFADSRAENRRVLDTEIAVNNAVIAGINKEAAARQVATSTGSSERKKLKKEETEFILTHEAVNSALDKTADILTKTSEKMAEFASEIKKLTSTEHGIKLLDIEDAYRKDMADIEKYKTDADRGVRELEDKIKKARDDAAKVNKKRQADDPIKIVDPKVFDDLKKMKAERDKIYANADILGGQAGEKRDVSKATEVSKESDRLRDFAAEQNATYAGITGTQREQYLAQAALLRAKLSTELADVKKTEEEKLAIKQVYDEKIRQAEELASGDFMAGVRIGLRQWVNEQKTAAEQVANIMKKAFDGMTDALTDFVMKGKADFKSLTDSIIRDLIRIAIQQSVTEPLAKNAGGWITTVVSFVGGLLSGGSGGMNTSDSTLNALALVKHGGGIIGSDSSVYRIVPSSVFNSAPRFHSGIGPGERPAIIRNDEGVFTPGQMAALGKGAGESGPSVTNIIINANDAKSFEDMCRRNPGALTTPIMQALRDNKIRPEFKRLVN